MSSKVRIRCPDCGTMMPYRGACPNCGRSVLSSGGMAKGRHGDPMDILQRTPYSECRAQDCVFNVTEQDETLDVKELSKRLGETIASYKKVHDELVARQAVLALQGVSPVREALSRASYPTGGKREGEVFNAQVAITDFSSSFAELEAEYTRLRSEGDVAQEIGRILEKTDRA